MSRIGKQPVIIPSGVTVTQDGLTLNFKGPKGELSLQTEECLSVEVLEKEIIVKLKDTESATKKEKSLFGLIRSLIFNCVKGVSEGFEKKLEIIGVGYKAQIQGKKIVLSLGFSHPVEFQIPEGVNITIDEKKKNILKIEGINKQKVGQAAANIRGLKPPEPYKGKGIKYIDEHIIRKAGKSAAGSKD